MSKKTKKIIVNGLTISRIVGAFIMPFIFTSHNYTVMVLILSLLFFTDFLDGKLSRFWHVQTMGGRLLDPLGDKLLAAACIIIAMMKHSYFWILLTLEILICIINIYKSTKDSKVGSSYIGKAKTWVLSVTLIFAVINFVKPELFTILASKMNFDINLTIADSVISDLALISIGSEIVTILCYIFSINKVKIEKDEKRKFIGVKKALKILFDEKRFEKDKDRAIFDIISK